MELNQDLNPMSRKSLPDGQINEQVACEEERRKTLENKIERLAERNKNTKSVEEVAFDK